MNTVHHGIRPAVKARRAVGGAAAFVAVCEAAHVVSVLAGPRGVVAGAALVVAVFAACWLVHRIRPLLHPVPLAPRSGTRVPEVATEPPALAGTAASR